MPYKITQADLQAVLLLTQRLDIATNPAPEAIFSPDEEGFQIWCTLEDYPLDRMGMIMAPGSFSKPCSFVANVTWGEEGDKVAFLKLETAVYDLTPLTKSAKIGIYHNFNDDINWARRKIRWLFRKARVPCPPIRVEPAEKNQIQLLN